MNLDKLIITLEKKGWEVSKKFLKNNEEYLQDLVNEAEKQALILFNVSGWLEFYGNEKLFNEMAKKNCPCRYDDGTQGKYNDKQPMAMLTHFKIV